MKHREGARKRYSARLYGGQTGIRLKATTLRFIQRNESKRCPGIPGYGALEGIFKVSLIP
jgi:hypothetical protein